MKSLFFSYTGYYFNSTGLLACEPFFSKPSYRILATCAFYFPTTMVLMYCYGSSFHANRYRLATTASSAFVAPAAIAEKVITNVQVKATSCWRSWIKLNFFLLFIILHIDNWAWENPPRVHVKDYGRNFAWFHRYCYTLHDSRGCRCMYGLEGNFIAFWLTDGHWWQCENEDKKKFHNSSLLVQLPSSFLQRVVIANCSKLEKQV